MRFYGLVFPALMAMVGTGWFLARPKPDPALQSLAARLDSLERAADERAPDEEDAAIIRKSLDDRDLGPREAGDLIAAAGRRYMRRKLAYARAQASGQSSPSELEALRRDMETGRRLCDLVESVAYRSKRAAADFELERRFFFSPGRNAGLVDRFDGRAGFTEADLDRLDKEFRAHFGRSLPVSARGASAFHRSMGLDHTGRFDVAVSPENSEGLWLRRYLSARNVSYFAFRAAVPGQATGAHIHIGPASHRR